MDRKHLCRAVAVVSAIMLHPMSANADWWNRTVTAVDGTFGPMSPTFGNEVGVGTSSIAWGVPLDPGLPAPSLTWEGYDAFPNLNQNWSFQGQTVSPGQRFLAGYLTFHNGEVAQSSSAPTLDVNLNVSAFGSEFYIDNHPLITHDTWRLSINQTVNRGVNSLADADFVYFTDFPQLGSIRVSEFKTAKIPVYAQFGSLKPVAFGQVDNPIAGTVVKSVVTDPVSPPPPIIKGGTGRVEGWVDNPLFGTSRNWWQPPQITAYSPLTIVGEPDYSQMDFYNEARVRVNVDASSTNVGVNQIWFDGEGSEDTIGGPMPLSVHGTEPGVLVVLDHSSPSFSDGYAMLNIDFGHVQAGSGMRSLTYKFANSLFWNGYGYEAGSDLNGVTEMSDPGGVFSTDPALFENLAPGELSSFFNVFLDTSTPGLFNGQYQFYFSDQKDLSGWDTWDPSGSNHWLTLNVTATVVPEPSALVPLTACAIACLWRRRRRIAESAW